MTINLKKPDITELKPRITVFGVGGGGGNAVNNMINAGLEGVDFVVANTDAQALSMNKAERIIQMGLGVTEGLGAPAGPPCSDTRARPHACSRRSDGRTRHVQDGRHDHAAQTVVRLKSRSFR